MVQDAGWSRRDLLRASGVLGVTGVAGCNEDSTSTTTTTPGLGRSSSGSTSVERVSTVFDGGDLQEFRAAVETAGRESGTLRMAAGRYEFDPLPAEDNRHVTIADVSDVTIDGGGATVVFTNPVDGAVQFERMRNLTIRDLTVDFDPVPFTQGDIVGVSEPDRTVDIDLDAGYPTLDHGMFQAETDLVWGSIHRPDGEFIRGYRGNVSLKFESFTHLGGRRYRVSLAERAELTGLRAGRRLTILSGEGQPAIDFFDVDGVTVENVTVHAGSGGGFATGLCTDPTYVGCAVVPPPGSDRHIGANADGFRLVNCLSSVTVRDCRVESIGDDGIVVQRTRSPVVEVVDDRTVDVSRWPIPVTVGDVLDVVSPTGVRKGRLPPVASVLTVGGQVKTTASGSRGQTPVTLTFEDRIDDRVAGGDLLGNRVAASRQFSVRNNAVVDVRGHCVRVATSDGVVAGNDLAGATHNVVELECDTWDHHIPKGWVENVVVRDNRISRSGLNWMAWDNPAAVYLHHRPAAAFETVGRPHRNIEIIGNVVTDSASVGLGLADAKGVSVRDNRIEGVNLLEYPRGGYGMRLSNLGDVAVVGNEVTGAGRLVDSFGFRAGTEGLTRSGNSFRLDGSSAPVVFRSWTPIGFEFSETVVPAGGHLALAVRIRALRLFDEAGESVFELDVGSGEIDDVRYGDGVFGAERDGSVSYRWFGGEDRTARVGVPRRVVETAATLEVVAEAYEPDIAAVVSIADQELDTITVAADGFASYRLPLP